MTEIATAAPNDFRPLAIDAPTPNAVIHVGDVVSVTLWEYGSGLLGSVTGPNPGGVTLVGAQSATVPKQSVDQTGSIIVPIRRRNPRGGPDDTPGSNRDPASAKR